MAIEDPKKNPDLLAETQEQEPSSVEHQRKRAELALETKENLDDQNDFSGQLESLDLEAPLNEQKEAIDSLNIVIEGAMLRAFDSGLTTEELKKSPLKVLAFFKENSEDKIASDKLKEIMSGNATWSSEYMQEWTALCDENADMFEDVKTEKEDLESDKPSEKTSWMSNTVRIGLIAAGAYGAYNVWKWFNNKKKGDKSKLPFLGGALATMGVGALIGPERMDDWMTRYMNISINQDSLKGFWSNLKNLKLKDAFSTLKFSSQEPGILAAHRILNIDKHLLIDLKDTKFSDFNSLRSDVRREGRSTAAYALELLGMDSDSKVPGTNLDDQLRGAKEEKILLSFIKNNRQLITGNINDKTISEILNELEENGAFKNEIKPENPPSKEDLDQIGFIENMENEFPSVSIAIDRLRNGETTLPEAALEITEGTIKDKAALVMKNGSLFLAKGTGMVYLSSAHIVTGAFTDIVEAMTTHGPVEGVSDITLSYFERGGGWWLAGGATVGATLETVNALKSGTALSSAMINGGLKGAAKGARYSLTAIPESAFFIGKQATAGKIHAKFLQFSTQELLAASPEQKIAAQYARARYHASQYKYYYDLLESAEKGGVAAQKSKWHQRLLPNWADDMLQRHGTGLLNAEEQLLKSLGRSEIKLDLSHKEFLAEHGAKRKVRRLADSLFKKIPEIDLPKITEFHYSKPTHLSHVAATEAGLPKLELSTKQMSRMKALGFNENLSLRVREMGLNKVELDDLLTKIEKDPKLKTAFETVLAEAKYPRLFQAMRVASAGLTVITALYLIQEFHHTEDKTNFLMENASMMAAFTAGIKGADFVIGNKLPVPFRIGADLVIGLGSATVGSSAWNSLGKPYLERNFPNRDDVWENPAMIGAGDFIALGTQSTAFTTAGYIGHQMGVMGNVDGTTDPLEYLQAKSRFIHPKTYFQIFSGDLKWIVQDHEMHDIDQLRARSSARLIDAKLELEEVRGKDSRRQKYLEKEIIQLEALASDTWIDQKKGELVMMKLTLLDPTNDHFESRVKKKFGEEGIKNFHNVMQKIQLGDRQVEAEGEREVWDYLSHMSVKVGGEVEMRFIDFISISLGVYRDMLFIEELEEKLRGGEEEISLNT